MKVTVTKEHINKGIRIHNSRCPFALALLDKFPRSNVMVTSRGTNLVRIFPSNIPQQQFIHSKNLQNMIHNHDCKIKNFKPGKYIITKIGD